MSTLYSILFLEPCAVPCFIWASCCIYMHVSDHRENSPVTQTTLEHTVRLGRMTTWPPNLRKISSEIESYFRNVFSSHCTQIWKLNRISMTIISKVARKCIWCCHWVQRWMTVPYSGELCSGAWKLGQDSHVGMFSLCVSVMHPRGLKRYWYAFSHRPLSEVCDQVQHPKVRNNACHKNHKAWVR